MWFPLLAQFFSCVYLTSCDLPTKKENPVVVLNAGDWLIRVEKWRFPAVVFIREPKNKKVQVIYDHPLPPYNREDDSIHPKGKDTPPSYSVNLYRSISFDLWPRLLDVRTYVLVCQKIYVVSSWARSRAKDMQVEGGSLEAFRQVRETPLPCLVVLEFQVFLVVDLLKGKTRFISRS